MKALRHIGRLVIAIVIYIGYINNAYAACEHGYFSSGGDGTESNPYLVTTSADLIHAFQEKKIYYYKQMNNIVITGGTRSITLAGIYDGNNKDLIVSSSYSDDRVFGGNTGTLKNVTFSSQTTGYYKIHTLLYGNTGTIENVTNKINMQGTGDKSLGAITRNNSGKIISCKNYGNFLIAEAGGTQYVGGIAAYNSGEISSCYSSFSLTVNSGTDNDYLIVGGIAGENLTKGIINNCYVQEINVTNNRSLRLLLFAGVAGLNEGSVKNSYALGAKVSGTGSSLAGNKGSGYVGSGIANNMDKYVNTGFRYARGTVTNCYYLDKNSIGVRGGRFDWYSGGGKTTGSFDSSSTTGKRTDEQMKSAEQVVLLNKGQDMPGWKAGTNGWLYPEPLGFVEMKMDTQITVIGDNTQVPLTIKWSSSISTIEIYDKTNNVSVYKGVPKVNLGVELSFDGDISLVCRGYSVAGELLVETQPKTVNKRSVLNEILKETISSVNPLRVMAIIDVPRHYDNNVKNQQTINKILEYNPPLYFISENLNPIFNVFLKTT